jgi:OHCU decarboxylase
MSVQALNALDREGFIDALGSAFEGPPWIVAQAWKAQPFASVAALYDALCAVIYAAPPERQIELLRAHPDLVGRAALAGTLSPDSMGEQAAAGLDRLTLDEIATFQRYNAAYREKYGFPFVICARENKKESILAGFAVRLEHTREQEIQTGLGEVAKICALRLRDLVEDDDVSEQGR